MQDRFGSIADSLDLVVDIKEADDAARASFEAFVAPRERADYTAFAQHHLDVAAEIFCVQ